MSESQLAAELEREQLEERKRFLQKLLQHTAASNRRSEEELHRLVVEERISSVSKLLHGSKGDKSGPPQSEIFISVNGVAEETDTQNSASSSSSAVTSTADHEPWVAKMWASMQSIRGRSRSNECSAGPSVTSLEAIDPDCEPFVVSPVAVPAIGHEHSTELDAVAEGNEEDDDEDDEDNDDAQHTLRAIKEVMLSNTPDIFPESLDPQKELRSSSSPTDMIAPGSPTNVSEPAMSEPELVTGIRSQIVNNLSKCLADRLAA
jgi:hypothetical protein